MKGKVIGIPEEYFSAGLGKGVKIIIEDAIEWYEQQGCEIKSISLPNTNLAIPAYYVIAPAECSSNLSRLMVCVTAIAVKIQKICAICMIAAVVKLLVMK